MAPINRRFATSMRPCPTTFARILVKHVGHHGTELPGLPEEARAWKHWVRGRTTADLTGYTKSSHTAHDLKESVNLIERGFSRSPSRRPLKPDTLKMIERLQQDVKRLQQDRKRDRRSFQTRLTDLEESTLPIASPIALKAGMTTLSLAYLLMAVRKDQNKWVQTLGLLCQLGWINKSQLASTPTPPTSNIEFLRFASFLLAPTQPQQLGQMKPGATQVFQRLSQIIGGVIGPTSAQRLVNSLLSTRPGGQVRLNRNVVAHEVPLLSLDDDKDDNDDPTRLAEEP
ncbi:hypothetical protein GGX14DRAFT_387020 [Mycena pura]|uniref:Uncharacterized protein n=1 Tax=Mycena pura TaxID=153505 RepID=A0AAD7E1Y8_9AGAR|nr:hypothetical protein GGX14DRAFT_387020 [Mycena pura]